MKILQLNKAGSPVDWITLQEAATLMAKEMVLWQLGAVANTLHGGTQRATGNRSFFDLPAIIATEGKVHDKQVPAMSNRVLFARDDHTCLYCGQQFRSDELTCDHVIPKSKGGSNSWTNCVTACKRCNHAKNNQTPEEWGTPLLAVPFTPVLFEYFYLSQRKVLPDQFDYLSKGFKNLKREAA